MKHCCIPKTTVSRFLGRPLNWGIIYTGKHIISIYTGKQYFHSEKYQRPCFRTTPQSHQTAHEGGESPTPFPNLSLRALKCPFPALSPCPIQILAAALPVRIFFILGRQIVPSRESRTHVLKFLARTLVMSQK